MNLHLEDNSLTGQFGVIVLGEGDVQLLLVAGFGTHELLLEAGDEGTGAQLQAVALGLAAIEGLAVQEALEVNHHSIAVLGRPLHGHHAGGTVDEGLELVVDVLIRDGDLGLLSSQALVLAQLHLGSDGDQGLEGQALLAHIHDLHLGPRHGIQLLLLNRLGIGLGVQVVDSILIKHAGAVHALDDLPGGLALAETGHADLAALLLVDLLDSGLELLLADLDHQLDGALLLLLDALDIHVVYFLLSALSRRASAVYGAIFRVIRYILADMRQNFHTFFQLFTDFLRAKPHIVCGDQIIGHVSLPSFHGQAVAAAVEMAVIAALHAVLLQQGNDL